jgi:hypothetical protein
MLFKPSPTVGSSGGPIVDEETGAVVGIMLGSRMNNRVEGVRGWGILSEVILEVCQNSIPSTTVLIQLSNSLYRCSSFWAYNLNQIERTFVHLIVYITERYQLYMYVYIAIVRTA